MKNVDRVQNGGHEDAMKTGDLYPGAIERVEKA